MFVLTAGGATDLTDRLLRQSLRMGAGPDHSAILASRIDTLHKQPVFEVAAQPASAQEGMMRSCPTTPVSLRR